MKTYRVPVLLEATGVFVVEAESAKEALMIAEKYMNAGQAVDVEFYKAEVDDEIITLQSDGTATYVDSRGEVSDLEGK